ncbi:MAG: transposase [Candidatus Sulfotelmatobacter sp.]
MMIIHAAKSLFAWDCLEDSPSLQTIRDLLAALPDGKLLHSLQIARGKGRNDYPVTVLWGVIVLRVALRHVTTEAVLAELRRNEGLRRLVGIESEAAVPKPWNISRFEEVLGQEPHRTYLKEVFNVLVQRLGMAVADLGASTAGDATGLSARRKAEIATKEEVTEGLPQASGGRKEYKDDQGKVTKVVEWFGFKLHLLVDVKHEVVLSYEITDTKTGDGETLPVVLEQAEANLPAGRVQTLAYDKAADSDDVHQTLSDKGITPLIQMRSLWGSEPERMLPGHDGSSNVVYDEEGTIYCYDKVSDPPVRHRMAYIGHEPERETLKYRCPAKHEGWDCPMSEVCNAGKSYGKTVRVPREVDPRRFPALPRATKKFERLYKGRTAVERVNARLKIFWGVDDGNITGSRRFVAQVGVVMAVHAAFATLLASAPRREGTLGKISLSPVAAALRSQTKHRGDQVAV